MMTTDLLIAIFIGLAAYYRPKLFDPLQKPKETPISEVLPEYDFIIVGAGSAGSVLGNRLSSIKAWKVLLLESGDDETPISKTPLFQKIYRNRSLTWGYSTVRQENACQELDGICSYPTGKVLGGSSSINGMLYARGSRYDYDEWEKMGCTGWSYNDVLPYFKRSEAVQVPSLINSNYHGTKGPLVVEHSKYLSELTPALIKAAAELGIPNRDYNGEYLTSAAIPQVTINGGQRWSASTAYLVPARDRSNLHIVKNVLVHKVLIDERTHRAIGVEYVADGLKHKVKAAKEVILSSGAINSPKILMLSGVGPKQALDSLGIPIIKDLPVGKNLQDHAQARLSFKMKRLPSIKQEIYTNIEEMFWYLKDNKGMYTYNGFAAMIFFSTGQNIAQDPPDVQIHVIDYTPDPFNGSVVTMVVNKAKPESRGSVKLISKDPSVPPLIDPKYFTFNKDIDDTLAGLETVIKLMKTSYMSTYEPEIYKEMHPHCRKYIHDQKEFLKCVIKYYSGTVFHPVGTVRMGPEGDPDAVVDPELRIIGVKNLRVVDASIMPKIIRANTNAPTMMIAEKAADIIRNYYLTYYEIN